MVASKALGERSDSPKAGGSGRVAVIGVVEGDELGAFWVPRLLPELHGHFDRRLDSRGSIVTEERAGQCARREEPAESGGEFGSRGVCCAKKRDMGDAVELAFDGGVDGRMAVAVDVCPDRGVSIKELPPATVAKDGPVTFDKDERIVPVGAPGLHLRERMPGVGLVPGSDLVGIPNVSHWGENYRIKARS